MRQYSGFMAVVVATVSTSLSADIPRLNLSLSTTEDSYAFSDEAPSNFFSGWRFNDTRDAGTSELGYSVIASEQLDSLIFSFQVENLTSTTQTYTLDAAMPVGPWIGPTYVGGSVSGFVTDANLDGSAILSTTGSDPLMTGFVDGQSSFSLGNGPLSTEATFLGGTAALMPQAAGLPGLDSILAANAVLTEISIRLTFTVSAGDTATLGGIFVARTIPAPGTVALFLAFGLRSRGGRRRE